MWVCPPQALEMVVEEEGAAGALNRRLVTRAWGNSRPLVWASGREDRGRANARVEMFLCHRDFEAPARSVPVAAQLAAPCRESTSERFSARG